MLSGKLKNQKGLGQVDGIGQIELIKTMVIISVAETYNIKHCIYCGKGGFKDVDEMILHVKTKHMVIGSV